MGSVLGIGLGVFMGAMGDVSPIQVIQGYMVIQYLSVSFPCKQSFLNCLNER